METIQTLQTEREALKARRRSLVGLLQRHLANEAEARTLIGELFVFGADLKPDDTAGTLTTHIHRMASQVHDRAITPLV